MKETDESDRQPAIISRGVAQRKQDVCATLMVSDVRSLLP